MSTSPNASMPAGDFVLVLDCPDRPGIVHAVSGFLVGHGGNILESQQYGDQFNGQLPQVAENGLNDLLFRHSTGSLQIDIPVVVSNHPDAERLVRSHGLDFAHLPVTPETKPAAEAELMRLVKQHDVDLVVLARYMQVLSDELCRELSGRAINIHHSFLPSFKGARPYHQAYDRGVKLVGATAHYVTGDLDEGPIIEQDVMRVDHNHTQEQLVAAGRDVEAQVLSRAVRWHSESRVLLNGDRTVIFR